MCENANTELEAQLSIRLGTFNACAPFHKLKTTERRRHVVPRLRLASFPAPPPHRLKTLGLSLRALRSLLGHNEDEAENVREQGLFLSPKKFTNDVFSAEISDMLISSVTSLYVRAHID